MDSDFVDSQFRAGLELANGRANDHESISRTLDLIHNAKGSRWGCLANLTSFHCASMINCWFEKKDFFETKKTALVVSKIQRIRYQEFPADAAMPSYSLLYPLISDNEPLIRWYAHNDRAFSGPANFNSVVDPKMANNPKRVQYHWLSTMLAARGDWRAVEERSLRFLKSKPGRVECTIHDHEFLLALSRGDKTGMTTALANMLKPEIYKRYDELGVAAPYAYGLIDTYGVIFTKIAWRNGHEIEIDHPYIPMEWMPIRPLDVYEDPYDFMKGFDIDQKMPPVPTIIPT
jgi:hypothetical protein